MFLLFCVPVSPHPYCFVCSTALFFFPCISTPVCTIIRESSGGRGFGSLRKIGIPSGNRLLYSLAAGRLLFCGRKEGRFVGRLSTGFEGVVDTPRIGPHRRHMDRRRVRCRHGPGGLFAWDVRPLVPGGHLDSHVRHRLSSTQDNHERQDLFNTRYRLRPLREEDREDWPVFSSSYFPYG